jgi:hypothetical protein
MSRSTVVSRSSQRAFTRSEGAHVLDRLAVRFADAGHLRAALLEHLPAQCRGRVGGLDAAAGELVVEVAWQGEQ